MARKSIDTNVLRFLYGKSGNKCAFPDCCEPIFEEDGTLTGECCHIEAYSVKGPRYNPITTLEQKNSADNLILLCSRHHKIIDLCPKKYTVEQLKEFKYNHEQQYSRETRVLNDTMLSALRHSMEHYWSELVRIDSCDDVGLKMKIDVNCDILGLLEEVENSFTRVEMHIESIQCSDNDMESDLRKLCYYAGLDYSKIEKVPYTDNPFCNRHWEIYNLAFPNCLNRLKLNYLQLCVKLLEHLTKTESFAYNELLEQYKMRLQKHHEENYFND